MLICSQRDIFSTTQRGLQGSLQKIFNLRFKYLSILYPDFDWNYRNDNKNVLSVTLGIINWYGKFQIKTWMYQVPGLTSMINLKMLFYLLSGFKAK